RLTLGERQSVVVGDAAGAGGVGQGGRGAPGGRAGGLPPGGRRGAGVAPLRGAGRPPPPPRPPRDPKTALQEWAQSETLGLPAYHDVGREGPDHAPSFTVEVRVEGMKPVRAAGSSKRAAERAAASIMLGMLGIEHDG
ncbi:MAG: putative dsRNA-binding protein, partial [Rhodospirillaceae bacterium]